MPALAGKFTIEIGRRPRHEAPLASHIEVFRRKIEMALHIFFLRAILCLRYIRGKAEQQQEGKL